MPRSRNAYLVLAAAVFLFALTGPAAAQSDAERLRALEAMIAAQQAQIESQQALLEQMRAELETLSANVTAASAAPAKMVSSGTDVAALSIYG